MSPKNNLLIEMMRSVLERKLADRIWANEQVGLMRMMRVQKQPLLNNRLPHSRNHRGTSKAD